MLEEITDANFKEKTATGICLVLFYKDPCPYCKTMKGVIEKFGTKVPVIKTMQINGLENAQSTKEHGVDRFPEILFFKEGHPSEVRQKGLTNPQGLMALLKTI